MGLDCLKTNENQFEKAVYVLPLSFQKLLVLIFYQPLKDEQHKYQNLIQRKKYQSFYVAKVLFPQVDEGFWLAILH